MSRKSINENKYSTKNNYKLVKDEDKKEFLFNLSKIKLRYWLNRPYTVFWATTFWKGVNEEYFAKAGFPGIGADNHLYQFPDVYYDEKFLEKGVYFLDKYFKKHKMADISENFIKMYKHHIRILKRLIQDKKKSIIERLLVFSELIRDYVPALWIIIPLEAHFNKRIALEVPKYAKGDYSIFVGDISIPRKKNAYVLMQDELLGGVSVKKVQKKFGWIKSRDGFTDFYTVQEIQEIKKNLKEPEKKKIVVPKELHTLSEELRELTFFRTDRTDKFYEFFGIARPFLHELAEYLDVKFEDLAFYDVNSIIDGNPKRYNKSFSYAAIRNRYIIGNDVLIPDLGKYNKTEIKGTVAFKGQAKGIVKIVTHPSEAGKVKNGDILVAQMTLPSFIAAMQKAAAFVTDEGGITCHAAIIAREMNKPCIIGTKIATKVLKDGDLVEIDASKGIVRKIK